MIKKIFLGVILFLFQAPHAFSHFLLISDIDDTIKRTHVLSTIDILMNGIRSRNPFSGMPELYLQWTCEEIQEGKPLCLKRQAINQKDNRIVAYVTAARSKFQWFSSLFLVNSGFPLGLYLGRDEGEAGRFKKMAIKELLKDFSHFDVIFIGDNGEQDPEVYEYFLKQCHSRNCFSFIHSIYPHPFSSVHVPYFTAADLAIHFFNHHWISEESLNVVTEQVLHHLLLKPEEVLPGWVVPPSFDFWPVVSRPISEKVSVQLKFIQQLIVKHFSPQEKFMLQSTKHE